MSAPQEEALVETKSVAPGRRIWWAWLLPLACAWVVYWPTLPVPFLLDDLTVIAVLQPEQGGPSLLPEVLWPSDSRFDFNHHFRPVAWLSSALDLELVSTEPAAIRAIAITLHGIVGLLVALLARALGGSALPAALAGCLFVAHGAAVEPVVWVCHRGTLLLGAFLILAALAAHSFARQGKSLALAALALATALAVFSKDSGIAFICSFPPWVWLAAPAGFRMRRALKAATVVAGVLALNLGLRRLATGHWLPSLETGSEAGSDLLAGLSFESAEANARGLLLPVANSDPAAAWPGWLAGSIGVLLAASLLLAARQRAAWLAAAWFVGLFILGLPQAINDPQLMAGSRAIYPMLPAFIVVMGLARGQGITWLLGAAVLLLAASARVNQLPFDEVRHLVEDAVAAVEPLARKGEPVRVSGLPATWKGCTAFGPKSEHFGRRFLPPLRVPAVLVGASDASALGDDPILGGARPARWIPFDLLKGDGRTELVAGAGLRWPSEAERSASAQLAWKQPVAADPAPLFPTAQRGGQLRLAGSIPVAAVEAVLLRLQIGDLTVRVVLPRDHPVVTLKPDLLRLELGPDPFALEARLAAATRAAGAAGVPATIEIELLPAAKADAALAGSALLPLRARRTQR